MSDQKFSEKIATEDIRAGVEKTNSRLFFSGIVLTLVFLGFWIRTCSKMPPDTNNSVECTKAGGQWFPEEYKRLDTNSNTNKIDAYCSLKKQESTK